jgi:DNA-directed RNA polymerase specialized sigma24 family protein
VTEVSTALAEALAAAASDDAGRRRWGVERLTALAEGGEAVARHQLGLLYAHGLSGLPCDQAAAARWCAAAAAQGLGVAQFNLALLHAAGRGVKRDAAAAAHWLRLAAANGVDAAEEALELVHAGQPLPATWDAAGTRTSVVQARSDALQGKAVRFAEYYCEPSIDLLVRQHGCDRDQAEDIVQQFLLELEEPLAKGEHRGLAWKESLRQRFDPGRGAFRPYLARVLRNFARDWQRSRAPRPAGVPAPEPPDLEALVGHHAEGWRALLQRFAAALGPAAPGSEAAAVLTVHLGEGLGQVATGARLGLAERTVRNRLRLGSELLLAWLPEQLAAAGVDDRALAEGLRLLPGWLHRPAGEHRARALLLLALVERRLGRRAE